MLGMKGLLSAQMNLKLASKVQHSANMTAADGRILERQGITDGNEKVVEKGRELQAKGEEIRTGVFEYLGKANDDIASAIDESKDAAQSQSDKVEISEEAKTASQNKEVEQLTLNTAQILGISEEELAQLRAARAEGLPRFGEVKLPASQLRVLQYQIQIVSELKGILHERGDLGTELSNLTHAFETVRERVSGDSNRHMNFLEDAFRGVIAGAFFRDAQLNTRTDIWTETSEGRVLNQEALAEFDPNLYKAALKASLVADNDDPEDYESLADELAAAESAKALRDTQSTEVESYNAVTAPVEAVIDSEA